MLQNPKTFAFGSTRVADLFMKRLLSFRTINCFKEIFDTIKLHSEMYELELHRDDTTKTTLMHK